MANLQIDYILAYGCSFAVYMLFHLVLQTFASLHVTSAQTNYDAMGREEVNNEVQEESQVAQG